MALEPPAYQLNQGLLRVLTRLRAGRRCNRRIKDQARPQRLKMGQPLGRNPERRTRSAAPRHASRLSELAKPLAPIGTRSNFRVGQHAKPNQRIMVETLTRIQETLETAGIVFISADQQGGPGVRLRDVPPSKSKRRR